MSTYKLTCFFDHIRCAMQQSNLTLAEVADLLTKKNISGVDIEYQEIEDEVGEKLAGDLKAVGLPISSVYCTFHWENKKAVDEDKLLNTLSRLNINNLLAIPGFVTEGQSNLDAQKAFLPKLQNLCNKANKLGITVLMEDFDYYSAPFGCSKDLRWFMDNIDNLGCAFDTGNFYYFGEDSYEVLPMFTDKIQYVHCKDRSITPKENETPCTTITGIDMYSSPVGSGIIKMDEILDAIKATGYNGVYAIEHFGSCNQLNDLLTSADYLNKKLG